MLTPSLLFLETSLVVVMVPNDELTAWLMLSVIKVPRRPVKVAPHTVELDVKPPAPHQDSLLPKIHQAAFGLPRCAIAGCDGR